MSGHCEDPAPQEVHHHEVRPQRELRGESFNLPNRLGYFETAQ